jgi:hypothetical protein
MIASHDIHIADAAQMRLSLVLQRSQLERPRLTVHKDLGSHDWQDLLSQRKSWNWPTRQLEPLSHTFSAIS